MVLGLGTVYCFHCGVLVGWVVVLRLSEGVKLTFAFFVSVVLFLVVLFFMVFLGCVFFMVVEVGFWVCWVWLFSVCWWLLL